MSRSASSPGDRVTLALLPGFAEAFMLAFARIGTMIMLLPGLGERAIPARMRLAVAVLLTLLLQPGLGRPEVAPLAGLLSEMAIGAVLGLSARLVLAAAETAGSFAAQGVGLSFAQVVDPTQGQQGDALAAFFRMTGVLIVFATDLHHLAIAGIAGSYQALPPGAPVHIADGLTAFLSTLARAFAAAVMLAAPFLVFGLVFNLGTGLLGRLAPQIQVFFLAVPLSVALGVLLLGRHLPSLWESLHAFVSATLTQILPLP
ncbi:MAG TPA: flagellar biosynthetic protein FliR [Beijerinckiaceae bacterium]|nr:flagellar biosynthetic protein FliR [Beijerinckiaceae bacterium]